MVGLNRWLDAATADNLYLAIPWVRDRANETDPAVKRASAKEWSGTYDDNGSCLDVAAVADPSADIRLQVLQSHPLVLTDGAVSIRASLTSACKADLRARYPHRRRSPTAPNTTFRIRNYTLRLTTYGPPHGQITVLVHQVDWLDAHPEPRPDTALVPIHEGAVTAPTWQKFRQARLEADRRCFLQGSDTNPTMAPSRNPSDEPRAARVSSPSSQLPFGTQAVHPPRHGTEEMPRNAPHGQTELQQNDTGNPQSVRGEAPDRFGMLSLLQRSGVNSAIPQNPLPAVPSAPIAPSTGSFERTHPANVQVDSTEAHPESRTPILPSPSAPPLEESRNDTPPPQAPSSPGIAGSTSGEPVNDDLDDPEPAWMKDCRPTCGCTNVSQKQRTLLSKPESWFKPEPGLRYPHANMPIEISKALLEEHAAANAQVEASSPITSDEDDGDEEEILPDAMSGSDCNEEIDVVVDEEMSDSPVSWGTSPPRESPRRPPLPPDSSFEAVQNDHIQETSRPFDDLEKPEPLVVDLADKTSGPPSSPPNIQEDQDSDDEMELELPRGLADSPRHVLPQPRSVVQVKETPHAKPTIGMIPSSARQQASSVESKHTSSTSIVHCTYKDPQLSSERNVSEPGPNEAASASIPAAQRTMTKDDPRAPVSNHVHSPPTGSVDFEMQDAPLELPQRADMGPQNQSMPNNGRGHTIVLAQPEPITMSAQQPPLDSNSSGNRPASTEQNQGQSTEPPRGISGVPPTKRKLENSPTKTSRRVTKRREIKIVGFGDSPARDTTAELRRARNESLARFRQEYRSASEDVTMCDNEESDVEQLHSTSIDTSANLRRLGEADRELQIGPSSTHGRVKGPIHELSSASHERDPFRGRIKLSDWSNEQASNRRIASATHDGKLSTDPTDAYTDKRHPLQSLYGVRLAPHEANQDVMAAPHHSSTKPHKQLSPSLVNGSPDRKSLGTVFQCFKATYPEYTGNVQHFVGQCKQMYKLDLEDKMVPKWQWDDFIIRNRTDYKKYILQCGDDGEDPEPYYRYYKDNIRNTLYNKGIVKSRSVLLTALRELDALPQETPIGTADTGAAARSASPIAPEPPITARQPSKQGRKSLPWVPTSSIDSSRDRPRHSLSTSTQGVLSKSQDRSPPRRTTLYDLPTSAFSTVPVARKPTNRSGTSTPATGNSLNGSALGRPVDASKIPTEPTGDEYRDFFFAWSRTTSFTGSAEADPTKPWPENLAVRRKAEVPRPKGYDVLDWKDEL